MSSSAHWFSFFGRYLILSFALDAIPNASLKMDGVVHLACLRLKKKFGVKK